MMHKTETELNAEYDAGIYDNAIHKYELVRGYVDPHFFMQCFLRDYAQVESCRFHREVLRCIPISGRGYKINILAPRGVGKSTCMTVVYPLWRICYKHYDEMFGFAPETFILVLSRSYSMAVSRIHTLKYELEDNEMIRDAFGDLVGDKHWGEKRIVTANGVQIVPIGRGGQIRGSLFRHSRPSLIISDDLDDPEKVENPDIRIKDQKWFDTDLMKAGAMDDTTNFINIDTIKHEEATAAKLQNRASWQTLFYQAIENPSDLWHPEHEDLWKQWTKLYQDMTVSELKRIEQSEQFYADNKALMHGDDIKELWPQVLDYKKVREQVADMGYWAVLRELQNSTRDPSQAIFDMENAIRFEQKDDGLLRSDDRLVKWQDLAGGSVFLDWASGKDTQDHAFAAAVCVLWEPLPGRRENVSSLSGCHAYVLSVWMDKVKLTQQIENAITLLQDAQATLHKTYDLKWRIAIEDFVKDYTGAISDHVYTTYREAKQRRNITLSLEFMPRYTDKVERIAALEPAITHGWLAFNNDLPPEYIKQMSQFPTADFMDGPDATEGACQMRVTEFISVKNRRKAERRRRTVDDYGYVNLNPKSYK